MVGNTRPAHVGHGRAYRHSHLRHDDEGFETTMKMTTSDGGRAARERGRGGRGGEGGDKLKNNE